MQNNGEYFYTTYYNEQKQQEHFEGACSLQAGFQKNIRDLQIQRYIFFITPNATLVFNLKTNIDNGRIYRLRSLKRGSGFLDC